MDEKEKRVRVSCEKIKQSVMPGSYRVPVESAMRASENSEVDFVDDLEQRADYIYLASQLLGEKLDLVGGRKEDGTIIDQ